MALFDSKNFNGEVFGAYVETTPNLNRNELIKSRAIKQNQELASTFKDQVGGNYAVVPMSGRIGGAAQNYNGSTNITASSTKTYTQGRIVVGRANAWVEKDFSYDITGGKDFLEQAANQVGEYWDEVDQATLLAELAGIFAMSTGAANTEFVSKHTYDISSGSPGTFSATTLNSAMQSALGDNKAKFALAIMHSAVATGLENLQLLDYLKYTDAQGIQRSLSIGTLNGRTVLVDDNMPVTQAVTTQGVWTFDITTAAVAGDKITILGTEYEFVANNTASPTATQIKVGASGTAAQQATNIVAILGAKTSGPETQYTIAVDSSTKVKFTQKTTAPGVGAPTATATQKASDGAIVIGDVTEVTASVETTKYTTYVLGEGAFEYTDCGAKKPYEVDRKPEVNGGEDYLYSRQRKVFAPYGISFTDSTIISPTDEQLATGSKWSLVSSNEDTPSFFPHKAIPIARIITKG